MEITYNYLKNVIKKEKGAIQNNPFIALVTLVLITIPLHQRYSNVALILLVLYSLFQLNKTKIIFQKHLVLPILLYGLMVFSLFWTIDFEVSTKALMKGLYLLLIPICFFINPPLIQQEKDKILTYFAYSFYGYALFYLLKATIRFVLTKDTNVFFYHELVTSEVNAIHVSVYISIAFFYFFIKKNKAMLDKIALVILLVLIFLLSSKNILVIFLFLVVACFFLVMKIKWNTNKVILSSSIIMFIGILFYGKIKDRFLIEIQSNKTEHHVNKDLSGQHGIVNNVSIVDAWTKQRFEPNDYFPGTALRVYQARIFKEMLQEDNSYLTGYGVNATEEKISQKGKEHNLYTEYGKFNFHNQYIQIFAELGILGFVLLVVMLTMNLKNAIQSKHFVHFSFAILMISLFLTESFLSRQRGIVFFIIMYCVFNSGFTKNDSIKE